MTAKGPSAAGGKSSWARLGDLVRSIIRLWALAGGALLVGIVLLTAYSAAANLLLHAPVPGDFEIVEMGVAVAVATFLPYCQLTYANVSVDIFTARAGPRAIAALTFLAALIALVIAGLLLWRMSEGFLDYRRYQEYTAIIGIPLWIAFPPFLISLALLMAAALLTAAEQLSRLGGGRDSAEAA